MSDIQDKDTKSKNAEVVSTSVESSHGAHDNAAASTANSLETAHFGGAAVDNHHVGEAPDDGVPRAAKAAEQAKAAEKSNDNQGELLDADDSVSMEESTSNTETSDASGKDIAAEDLQPSSAASGEFAASDVVDKSKSGEKRGSTRGGTANKKAKKTSRKDRLAALPEHQRKSRRTRRALTIAIILLIVLLGALVYLGYELIKTSQNAISQTTPSQGNDATQVAESGTTTKDATTDTVKRIDVPALASVIGSSRDEAISLLGHGATLTLSSEVADENSAVVETDTVMLTADASDSKLASPTVYLSLDEAGTVVQVSYTAATASLGYGTLSFADAVSNEHVIEKTLSEAGLLVQEETVELPDRGEYSTYAADGTTLTAEKYSFSGTAPATSGSASFNWAAVLSYDYTASNASGNLSDTVRMITISLSASA
ncbi:hypothetical protein Ccur_12280 [Cryptobacterium curtum DSM 15641]|uniref:Histone-lysine N-methyltransferase n=1 Tax=Cryptobacterium curtum (strain ATCC 700683 / DSM 15641 / CCUG 43107 / 12-3) TaxID=469378 RepID=C7MKW6_CRYCD|nr:hypothetical protein [Cryptobacterium curtum]ACU94913.1 hypothetical protein Ccur_12280 [Cryptobacterium curtum DSM 15641]